MRELKFRAWNSKHSIMVEVGQIDFLEETFQIGSYEHPIGRFPIMQYTGYKDVNDTEVYEHDIVDFTIFDYNGADTQYTGVVVFNEGQWQLWKGIDEPNFGADGPFSMQYVWYNCDTAEVIGNIYEHRPKATVSTESA